MSEPACKVSAAMRFAIARQRGEVERLSEQAARVRQELDVVQGDLDHHQFLLTASENEPSRHRCARCITVSNQDADFPEQRAAGVKRESAGLSDQEIDALCGGGGQGALRRKAALDVLDTLGRTRPVTVRDVVDS